MQINLGDKAKDNVSGFTGIVVARCEWLNGCVRLTIQPPVGKDGKLPDSGTFDEDSLFVLKTKAVADKVKTTGGSQNDKMALRR